MDTDQHKAGSTLTDQAASSGSDERRMARKNRRMKGIAAFRAAAQEITERSRLNRQALELGSQSSVPAKLAQAPSEMGGDQPRHKDVSQRTATPRTGLNTPESAQAQALFSSHNENPRDTRITVNNGAYAVPEAASHEPEAASHEPEAASHEPEAASHEPEAASHEPEAASHEPEAASHEPEAASHEPEAASHEPEAASHEPEAASHEPEANQNAAVAVGTDSVGEPITLSDNLVIMDNEQAVADLANKRAAQDHDVPQPDTKVLKPQAGLRTLQHVGAIRDHEVLAKLVAQKMAVSSGETFHSKLKPHDEADVADGAEIQKGGLETLEKATRNRSVELERHLHDSRLLRPVLDESSALKDGEEILAAPYLAVRPRGSKAISPEKSDVPWSSQVEGDRTEQVNIQPSRLPGQEEIAVVSGMEVGSVTESAHSSVDQGQPWTSSRQERKQALAQQRPEHLTQDFEPSVNALVRKSAMSIEQIKQRMLTLEPDAPWYPMVSVPATGAADLRYEAQPKPMQPVQSIPMNPERKLPFAATKPMAVEPLLAVPSESSHAMFAGASLKNMGGLLSMEPPKQSMSDRQNEGAVPHKVAVSSLDLQTLVQRIYEPKKVDPWGMDAQIVGNLSALSEVKQSALVLQSKSLSMKSEPQQTKDEETFHLGVGTRRERPLIHGWMELLTALPVNRHADVSSEPAHVQPQNTWLDLLMQQPDTKKNKMVHHIMPVASKGKKKKGAFSPLSPWLASGALAESMAASLSTIMPQQISLPTFTEALVQAKLTAKQQVTQNIEAQSDPETVVNTETDESVASPMAVEDATEAQDVPGIDTPAVVSEITVQTGPVKPCAGGLFGVTLRKKRFIHTQELKVLKGFMGQAQLRGPWGVEPKDPFASHLRLSLSHVEIKRRNKKLQVGVIPFAQGAPSLHGSDILAGSNRWGAMYDALHKKKPSSLPPLVSTPPSLAVGMHGYIFNDKSLSSAGAMHWYLGEVTSAQEQHHLPETEDGNSVRRSDFNTPSIPHHAIVNRVKNVCFLDSPFEGERERQQKPRAEPDSLLSEPSDTTAKTHLFEGKLEKFSVERMRSKLPKITQQGIRRSTPQPASPSVAQSATSSSLENISGMPTKKALSGRVTTRPSLPAKRLYAKVVRKDKSINSEKAHQDAATSSSVQSLGSNRVAIVKPVQRIGTASEPTPAAARQNGVAIHSNVPVKQLDKRGYVEAVEVEGLGEGVANLLGDAVGGVILGARWTGGVMKKMVSFSKR
ncbi:hypothetical protein Mmc1_2266 [Magnetococcus marinus MC-1]|uniref:Uncharacterized protein n=1 Tax=Magnetococcus marinus (strain ATCC BAA-1437 / JCM 17883 / MC-1) TaxID=156889 RepID=A0L9X4_MAGMM|nr:hypothetical protein [Magnetococcus marinus]ABK44767.1 hypothetical protein Mmc1_2266 [Magnetococcus marinus MC-1]